MKDQQESQTRLVTKSQSGQLTDDGSIIDFIYFCTPRISVAQNT